MHIKGVMPRGLSSLGLHPRRTKTKTERNFFVLQYQSNKENAFLIRSSCPHLYLPLPNDMHPSIACRSYPSKTALLSSSRPREPRDDFRCVPLRQRLARELQSGPQSSYDRYCICHNSIRINEGTLTTNQ